MKGRIVAAILLLVVGVAWLLDIQGRTIFPGGIATWWPSILILVGLVQLAVSLGRHKGGLVLVAVGAVFQAWTLGYLPTNWWKYIAPVALILIALLLLLPPWRRAARRPPPEAAPHEWDRETRAGTLGPESVAVFSEHHLHAPAGAPYPGGEVTAVFGSLEADLREATLPPAGARMKATSVFGGVRIRVPPGWHVEVHGTPVLGSTIDRTRGGAPDGPKLEIEAVAVFGSVEVTNG